MLGRGDVTDQIRTVAGRLGGSDRGNHMVVAGTDIGRQRPQHVVGCVVAHALLQDDVGLDFVQGDMPRPFHHHLTAHAAAFLGQFAVDQQLLNHRAIKRVANGPRPQAVSQRQDHVVFFKNRHHAVEFGIQWIFAMVGLHPCHHRGAALAHKAAVTVPLLFQPFDGVLVDAAMDGHETDAIGALPFDNLEKHSSSSLLGSPNLAVASQNA